MVDAVRVDDAQARQRSGVSLFLKNIPSFWRFFLSRDRKTERQKSTVDLLRRLLLKNKKENYLFVTRHGETMT